jgi:hypothetical protein
MVVDITFYLTAKQIVLLTDAIHMSYLYLAELVA